MLSHHISRRQALAVLGAGALAVTLAACGGGGDDAPTTFWGRIAAAARAAGAPVDTIRARRARDVTSADIESPTPAQRDRLVSRIADDYRNGATVVVDGWLLSETEVALALVIDR